MLVFIVFLSLSPFISYAQTGSIVPCSGALPGTDANGRQVEECGICHIGLLAQNILNTGIYIAVFIGAILFAWAGWKYVTARGNPGEMHSARGIFINVIVGLLIILGGWLVVDTLMVNLLDGDKGFGRPWAPICGS